jgi:hypothetical protein
MSESDRSSPPAATLLSLVDQDHEAFMRDLADQAHAAIAARAACPWCGVDCDRRAEHEQYHRASETTWRAVAA